MVHAPKYWAAQISKAQHIVFWHLVTEWGFSGESAYHMTLNGAQIQRRA